MFTFEIKMKKYSKQMWIKEKNLTWYAGVALRYLHPGSHLMPGSRMFLNANGERYASICADLWIFLNIREILRVLISQSPKYV